MAIAGRKPKQSGQVRHRVPPRHEWVEVEDRPFTGRKPALPRRRAGWPPSTKRWWAVVREMPHCVLWTKGDWQFALDTAEVHARWVEYGTGATELRIREARMGTTMDAHRDLRIRYVEPGSTSGGAREEQPKGVVRLDDYRDLYG